MIAADKRKKVNIISSINLFIIVTILSIVWFTVLRTFKNEAIMCKYTTSSPVYFSYYVGTSNSDCV